MSASALPPNWIAETLDGVAQVHDDLREPVNAEERKGRVGPYPYYGATGQVGWIDDFLMDGEYVLLGEDGAPFLDPSRDKAYLVTGKSWVNNHAHVLQGKEGVCRNRFLLHALNHMDYRGFANGTTRLKLTQAAMRRLPIRLPPPPEQDRIVAKIEELFSDLDAGVAALERVRANLKRYRAAVLKAAVEGRLTEEWRTRHPASESAAELLERILTERRAKWEQDQLRKFKEAGKTPPKGWKEKYEEPPDPDCSTLHELPKGWCWATADQLIDPLRVITYGVIKLGEAVPDGVPTLRTSDVRPLHLDLSDVKRISPTIASEFGRTFLQGGEVLVAVRGTLGGVALAPPECRGFNISREVAMLAIANPAMGPFVTFAIGSKPLQVWLLQRTRGIAYTGINIETLRQLPVPIPPLGEQAEIVAEVDRRLSVADAVETQVEHALQRAARLRQAILKRAFEGKLVEQDPTDEPAATMLECAKAQANGHRSTIETSGAPGRHAPAVTVHARGRG